MDTTEPKGSVRRRGLGRGLDALLGAAKLPHARTSPDDRAMGVSVSNPDLVRSIPLEQIQRGRYQPRRTFDPQALEELADSIRVQGILQPIVVRPLAEPAASGVRYEIIAGERRWRAAQLIGLTEIPAVVRRVDERTALAIALIENIQRAALNPLEEAEALARLVSEFELTHQEVAEAVGRSRAAVTNALRLLDLQPEVKTLLASGRIEMGHARALLGLKDSLQTQVAQQVAEAGLSVRATERLVRRLQQSDCKQTRTSAVLEDPDICRLQADLTERLGARVQIRHQRNGRGTLVIAYESLDELDGILARLR